MASLYCNDIKEFLAANHHVTKMFSLDTSFTSVVFQVSK